MDPNVQGSFIPKQALSAQARGGGMGLFFLLALLLFVMSIVAAGVAYGYQHVLDKQIGDKDVSLRRAEGAFDAGAIDDLSRMDSRLTQAKTLLQKHISTSALFTLLSTITLEHVQLQGMNFALQTNGAGTLTLSGTADSFSTVALQSDQFGASKMLHDVIFSGIAVGEKGKVSFTVSANVDPAVLLYSKNVTQQPAASPATTTRP